MTSIGDVTRPDRARPLSVTLVSWLFIVAGAVGIMYHASELDPRRLFQDDATWILLVRLLAVTAGAFMLRGSNWARWLAIAWLAYHVVLSAFHGWQETIVHFLFFAGVAYLLFRPNASAYFGRSKKVW